MTPKVAQKGPKWSQKVKKLKKVAQKCSLKPKDSPKMVEKVGQKCSKNGSKMDQNIKIGLIRLTLDNKSAA